MATRTKVKEVESTGREYCPVRRVEVVISLCKGGARLCSQYVLCDGKPVKTADPGATCLRKNGPQ